MQRSLKGRCGDPSVCAPEELAGVREAARIVGIGDVRVLGHKARELAAAPPQELRAPLDDLFASL